MMSSSHRTTSLDASTSVKRKIGDPDAGVSSKRACSSPGPSSYDKASPMALAMARLRKCEPSTPAPPQDQGCSTATIKWVCVDDKDRSAPENPIRVEAIRVLRRCDVEEEERNLQQQQQKQREKEEEMDKSLLWTEKHRPSASASFEGNEKAAYEMKKWIQAAGDAPMPFCLVLEGPVGCGKTSLVYAVAKENGYVVKEINANCHSKRTDTNILEVAKTAVQRKLNKDDKPGLVLFDDLDSLHTAQTQSLISTIKPYFKPMSHGYRDSDVEKTVAISRAGKEVEVVSTKPVERRRQTSLIVITCTDFGKIYRVGKEESVYKVKMQYGINRPILRRICDSECLDVSDDLLTHLCKKTPNNLRLSITILEWMARGRQGRDKRRRCPTGDTTRLDIKLKRCDDAMKGEMSKNSKEREETARAEMDMMLKSFGRTDLFGVKAFDTFKTVMNDSCAKPSEFLKTYGPILENVELDTFQFFRHHLSKSLRFNMSPLSDLPSTSLDASSWDGPRWEDVHRVYDLWSASDVLSVDHTTTSEIQDLMVLYPAMLCRPKYGVAPQTGRMMDYDFGTFREFTIAAKVTKPRAETYRKMYQLLGLRPEEVALAGVQVLGKRLVSIWNDPDRLENYVNFGYDAEEEGMLEFEYRQDLKKAFHRRRTEIKAEKKERGKKGGALDLDQRRDMDAESIDNMKEKLCEMFYLSGFEDGDQVRTFIGEKAVSDMGDKTGKRTFSRRMDQLDHYLASNPCNRVHRTMSLKFLAGNNLKGGKGKKKNKATDLLKHSSV